MKINLYKIFIIFLFVLFADTMVGQQTCFNKYSVLFGSTSKRNKHLNTNITRIFIDKEGLFYPESNIQDKDLRKNNSSLSEWYKNNQKKFAALCLQHKIIILPNDNLEEKINKLNEAIANDFVSYINQQSIGYTRIDIIIHGFCKKLYKNHELFYRSSLFDNRKLEKKLTDNTQQKIFFVEIYWDGMFIGPINAFLHNKGYFLFKNYGIPNALSAGLSLRKIVSNITKDRINVISHSLGAEVACELLFNASNSLLLKEENINTPDISHIKICLIAPSVGSEIFKNYYNRGNKSLNSELDNYKLAIAYNTNDMVLNKHLTILNIKIGKNTAIDFANTSLGCNYNNDIEKLNEILPKTSIKYYNLSYKNKKPVRGHYLFRSYIKNKKINDIASYLDN